MTPLDDPKPAGILVIDGAAMSLALSPDDVREVAPASLVAGDFAPEAVLVLAIDVPRRQRIGTQALAVNLLQDYPFYALVERCGEEARAALQTHRTPFDRFLTLDPPTGPFEIPAADASTATLLGAVFADLPANLPPDAGADGATARLHAKWRFGDIKRELAGRLGWLARESARANRPLRLAHLRCGDGALTLAVPDTVTYVAIDDRPASRAQAEARTPGLTVHAPEALSREAIGDVGVFLFTDVLGAPDLEDQVAALRPVAALSARRAVVIGLLPHGSASHGSHGIINEPRVSRLTLALQRLFEGPCELRRIVTIAHKPFDALPGTTLVEFEVGR